MANLKPCPFCGGDKIDLGIRYTHDRVRKRVAFMECDCGGEGPSADAGTEDDNIDRQKAFTIASELWNMRAEQEARETVG